MKVKLQIVGKTTDNKDVYAGVFELYGTLGIPLAAIFEKLEQVNGIPSWTCFVEEAIKGGWSNRAIITRLKEALGDWKGSEYSNLILNKLKYLNII